MSIKSIRKYVTTDGIEFNDYDTALKHQDNIDNLGESIRAGDEVIILRNNNGYDYLECAIIKSIRFPLIEFERAEFIKDDYSLCIVSGLYHIANISIVEINKVPKHLKKNTNI